MPNKNLQYQQKNHQTSSSFFQKAGNVAKDAKSWITPAIFSMLMTATNAEETRPAQTENTGLIIVGFIFGGFVLSCGLAALDSSMNDYGRYDVRPHHTRY